MARQVLNVSEFNVGDTTDIGTAYDAGYTSRNNAQIVGQRLRATGVSVESVETLNTISTPASKPCWGSAVVSTIQGAGARDAWVLLRAAAPPTVTYYQFGAQLGEATSSAIYRVTAGASVLIASETATTWAPGDELRAEITFEGASQRLKLYRNDAQLLSVIDDNHTTGRYGLVLFTSVLADLEMDTVKFGDFITRFPTRPSRPRPFSPGLAR